MPTEVVEELTPDQARVGRLKLRYDLFEKIGYELDRAYNKHGALPWGRHEFFGILYEEVDELWDAIKQDLPREELLKELVQVAAMCVRYYETGDRYGQ